MNRQLLITFFTLVLASSSNQTNASSNLRQQQRQLLKNERELQEGTSRIFARYGGPRGHRIAKKCAHKIIQDKDDDDIIIFEGSGLCMEQLQRDTDIIEAEFDNEVRALGSGGENFSSRRSLEEIIPWGLEMIQADQLEAGDNEITICIVDSGLACGHPDFDASMITGNDTTKFYGPIWKWDADVAGHGTHVAGTIAAMAGNDRGVAGAGHFRLHIARALGDDGRGYESDIRNAVQQCVDAGAKIINLSLGGPYISYLSNKFYTEVVEEQGVLIVAAAGNDGTADAVFPASHPSVIAVSAVYEWGTRWIHSNQNNQVEFAAPGHNVLSTTTSTSAVQVDGYGYPAFHIAGTSSDSMTGELVFCEADALRCKDAKNGGICIMAKDGTSIQDMIDSCRQGGGTGAVIFGADSNAGYDSWSVQQVDDFRAVAIKNEFGNELMGKLGESVSIGDYGNDHIEYTYTTQTGTSMATPHVSAAAALLWSHFGDCANHQIRYALARTADNPDGSCNEGYGYGIVKVSDAYDWLKENDCNTWSVPQLSQGGCTTL
jgi:subtilisin family serine protease